MRSLVLGRLRAVVVLVLVALLSSLSAPAGAQSAEERRLAANRERVAAIRAQIDQASAAHQANASVLSDAQAKVDAVLEAVYAAEAAVQRQQQAVGEAQARLGELEQQYAEQRRLMTARAVEMYQHGVASSFTDFLQASSPQDALRRSSYAERVADSDQASVESVDVAQRQVVAQRERLQAEEAVLARVVEQQEALLADAAAIRDSRALAAAGTAEQLDQLRAQERHLEAESQRIAAIARRNAEAAASRAAAATVASAGPSADGWAWPASGPVTSGFGRRWGRMHEGIDIGAASGAPIWAARDGIVTYTGRMGGYGNLVLIDHGGGIVTAYAHQSRIATSPGARVSAGQRIGSVGSTGNSTGSHLHFEVRVGGSPRNPLRYLP